VTRDSVGAHLSKEARFRTVEHVVVPEPTSAGRRGPKLRDMWQYVDVHLTPCLDLKLVCEVPDCSVTHFFSQTRETGKKRSEEKTVTTSWKPTLPRLSTRPQPSLHTLGSSLRNFAVQPSFLPPPRLALRTPSYLFLLSLVIDQPASHLLTG
jgi:hypothetical protein